MGAGGSSANGGGEKGGAAGGALAEASALALAGGCGVNRPRPVKGAGMNKSLAPSTAPASGSAGAAEGDDGDAFLPPQKEAQHDEPSGSKRRSTVAVPHLAACQQQRGALQARQVACGGKRRSN